MTAKKKPPAAKPPVRKPTKQPETSTENWTRRETPPDPDHERARNANETIRVLMTGAKDPPEWAGKVFEAALRFLDKYYGD